MIEKNRLKKEEGDAAFNFADGRKIKRLHLTKELHAQLTKGTLAIVKLGDQYELVTPEIAKKIAARDDKRVILQNTVDAQAAEDDEYKGFEVPDDLTW